MKVSELVKILSTCAPSDEVVIFDSRNGVFEEACSAERERMSFEFGGEMGPLEDLVEEGDIALVICIG